MLAASLIEDDPVLTAKLLKTANSAFFGLHRSVSNARDAINVLGLIKVRALVIAASLGEGFHTVGGVNLNQFWRYSLHTAKLARSLAGSVHQNQVAAYTVGLLHGLGELLIHLSDPERVQSLNTLVPPLDLRRCKVEMRIFGYCYSRVTAALARRWQLPEMVVDALSYQHAPFENHAYEPLAGVIHLAVWRVRVHELGLDERERVVSFPDEVALALGLDIDMVLRQDPIDWTPRHEAEPEAADYLV